MMDKLLERITLANWKTLNIMKGDKVYVEVSDDCYIEDGLLYYVSDVEDGSYDESLFMELEHMGNAKRSWYTYVVMKDIDYNEIYLLRTEDGSYNIRKDVRIESCEERYKEYMESLDPLCHFSNLTA